MSDFEYVRAKTIEETVKFLAAHGADTRILAGGTDLLIQLRNNESRPSFILDLKHIPELQTGVQLKGDVVSISATVTMSELIMNPLINRYFPALIDAASAVGSVQIRNRATLVGNICNASPAADSAPPLLVYGADVIAVGTNGTRRIPLNDFFVRSGVTSLQDSEFVTSVELPVPSVRMGAAHVRRTRRKGHDLASVTLCCGVEETGTTKICYGSVGPRPILAIDTSGILADQKAPEEAKTALFESIFAQASPSKTSMRASPTYRLAMLRVLGKQALKLALSRLNEGGREI